MSRLDRFFGRIFAWCEKNPVFVIVIFFAVTLAIRYSLAFLAWRFLHFPFQRYDPYMYTVKGMEIAVGDWSPIRTHGLGWSAVLGAVFRVWHGSSILENLAIASFVAAVFSALSFFPLMYIGKKVDGNPRTLALLAVLFLSSFFLTVPENDSIAMADPLFVFLFLVSVCFLYSARTRLAMAFACGAVAAIAYFTKPVGIFTVPLACATFFLWHCRQWGDALRKCALFVSSFALVSAPFLWQRHAYFGSFFDYGENSKYFADTYAGAWGEAVSAPSFLGYMGTHGMLDYANKFLIGGVCFVAAAFLAMTAPYILSWVKNAAHGAEKGTGAAYPLFVGCAVWFVGLIPVFHIYGNPRHLLPAVALSLVLAATGFRRFADATRLKNVAYAGISLFAALFLFLSFASLVFFSKDKKVAMRDGAVWARHLAPLLKGNVAIGNGSDILMMQYPDSRVGGKGMLDMYAPQSGVAVRYPGMFSAVEAFRPWLKTGDIDYVVFDDVVKESFPFAPDKYLSIYTGTDFPPYLVPFYSNYESNSQWKVRVFSVNKDLL